MEKLKTSELLSLLKQPPTSKDIDHIEILELLYWRFSSGEEALSPIMTHYLDSNIENTPSLKEKINWNDQSFKKARLTSEKTHPILIQKIKEIQSKINIKA